MKPTIRPNKRYPEYRPRAGIERILELGYRWRMPQPFRSVENWADYTFSCPEGKWTARLDNKSWGKGKVGNLILYFSEVGNDNKYWLSVFWDNGYCADDEALSFATWNRGPCWN